MRFNREVNQVSSPFCSLDGAPRVMTCRNDMTDATGGIYRRRDEVSKVSVNLNLGDAIHFSGAVQSRYTPKETVRRRKKADRSAARIPPFQLGSDPEGQLYRGSDHIDTSGKGYQVRSDVAAAQPSADLHDTWSLWAESDLGVACRPVDADRACAGSGRLGEPRSISWWPA
jgi:hypothetical protein